MEDTSTRKRKHLSIPAPSLKLTAILSGLVLVAYALSIIGIIAVIDSQTSEGRSLATTPTIDISPTDLTGSIPKGVWPVTLRDELDDFEDIEHPADPSIRWTVPKFWSPPIHNNELMTRSTAMQIGTCVFPDDKGNQIRGADCPLHQRTMFVMIASYRDFQCRETIESIYGRADYPERIRVAVVDQIVEGDDRCNEPIKPCDEDPQQALCQYADLVDVVTLDARESVGPVPARHVGHRMYRGEYYAIQSDAHVSFVNGWDMKLTLELESTGNEMAVLSTYLSDFVNSIDENGDLKRIARPIMCNSYFKESQGGKHIHHSTQPESLPAIHGMPQLHPWWSAGFSFSRGHFVVNVPYDRAQPMVFSGEEMSIAIRGWTIGYDYYTSERSACFHHYAESEEGIAKRKNVPTFWENSDHFEGVGRRGMARLLGIVHMGMKDTPRDSWDHTDEDIYGIGDVRTPEQLFRILGIDVQAHNMEGHLCHFVNRGKMHRMFQNNLRNDGMGLDYTDVDFEWKDDAPELAAEEEEE